MWITKHKRVKMGRGFTINNACGGVHGHFQDMATIGGVEWQMSMRDIEVCGSG